MEVEGKSDIEQIKWIVYLINGFMNVGFDGRTMNWCFDNYEMKEFK